MNKYALIIIMSFAGLIGAGTLLLMMPFSTVSGVITFENVLIVFGEVNDIENLDETMNHS